MDNFNIFWGIISGSAKFATQFALFINIRMYKVCSKYLYKRKIFIYSIIFSSSNFNNLSIGNIPLFDKMSRFR